MGIQFDSISPLPSGPAALAARQRKAERQQRQERGTALRRGQLLDVAFELFEELGNQGFNMRQMAQRAGYTPGALYAYFHSKDAILSALRRRVMEQLANEVRAVKPPKPARNSRELSAKAGLLSPVMEGDARAQARGLFVAQSLAWWGPLAREPHRLQLLLKSGEPTEPIGRDDPASEATVLALLGETTAPALGTLHAMGMSADGVQSLHDEVLAYGMGLLVLQPGAALETRFVQTLHRWLDRECALLALPAANAGDVGAERQGDLFAG